MPLSGWIRTRGWRWGNWWGSSGRGSGDAELRAVNLDTGKVAWSEPGLGRSTMILVDGHVIVLAEDGRLIVIEATPEEYREVSNVVIEAPLNAGETPQPLLTQPAWNAPALSKGRLYVRGKDRLVCLDVSR